MNDESHLPEELEDVWHALGSAAPESLSSASADRIRRNLQRGPPAPGERRSGRHSPWRLVASIGLALLVGAGGGYAVGLAAATETSRATATGSSETTATPVGEVADLRPAWLLLLHETGASERAVRERGLEVVVREYAAWAEGLATEGRLVSAGKLSDSPAWVGTDAPEEGSTMSGFFVVRAADREEALSIATGSPHAVAGGIVEVRRIEDGEGR